MSSTRRVSGADKPVQSNRLQETALCPAVRACNPGPKLLYLNQLKHFDAYTPNNAPMGDLLALACG